MYSAEDAHPAVKNGAGGAARLSPPAGTEGLADESRVTAAESDLESPACVSPQPRAEGLTDEDGSGRERPVHLPPPAVAEGPPAEDGWHLDVAKSRPASASETWRP